MFANMLGKYLNVGDDNGKNDELQNVGTLKSIITGGRVTLIEKIYRPLMFVFLPNNCLLQIYCHI